MLRRGGRALIWWMPSGPSVSVLRCGCWRFIRWHTSGCSRCSSSGGSGQALVEFALVLPLMMLLVVGGIYFGLALILRQEGTWEAQQAVQAAIRYTDPAARCRAASGVLWALSGQSPSPSPTCTEDSGLTVESDGTVLTVRVLHRLAPPPFLDGFMPHCSDGAVCIAGRAGLMLP